jgi:hypothetical protein
VLTAVGIIADLATLVALGLGFFQLRRVATAALAAKRASEETAASLSIVDGRSAAREALHAVQSAREIAISGVNSDAARYITSARHHLIEARTALPLSEEEQVAFQEAIALLADAGTMADRIRVGSATEGETGELVDRLHAIDQEVAECLAIAQQKVAANAKKSGQG